MSKIENIEKTFNEIARVLVNDETLCRLLYIDSSNALTKSDFTKPTLEQLFTQKYINTTPQQQSGIQEIGRNTFLILRIADLNFSKEGKNISVNADCSIVTTTQTATLDGNRDRALAIAGIVEDILTNYKFSSAGEVEVSSVSNVVYSEYEFGYIVSFSFQDQVNIKKVEI